MWPTNLSTSPQTSLSMQHSTCRDSNAVHGYAFENLNPSGSYQGPDSKTAIEKPNTSRSNFTLNEPDTGRVKVVLDEPGAGRSSFIVGSASGEPNESDDKSILNDESPSSSCLLKIPNDTEDPSLSRKSSCATLVDRSVNASTFWIIDSTLREGEQLGTASFTTAQKIEIAKALDDFGIDYIELTSPAASAQSRADCEAIRKLGLKAKIICPIRCNMDDAKITVQTGVAGINICIGSTSQSMAHPSGSKIAAKATCLQVIRYLKEHKIEVSISGEDSFRSDFNEVLKLYDLAAGLGADRVGIAADTASGATPLEVQIKINTLKHTVKCDIKAHFRGDTDCALANAYAALKAGATHIKTSVWSTGEKNSVTPLRGLITRLRETQDGTADIRAKFYEMDKLEELEKLVAGILGGGGDSVSQLPRVQT